MHFPINIIDPTDPLLSNHQRKLLRACLEKVETDKNFKRLKPGLHRIEIAGTWHTIYLENYALIARERGHGKPGYVYEVRTQKILGSGAYGKVRGLKGKIKKEGEDSVAFVEYKKDTKHGYVVKEQKFKHVRRKIFDQEAEILQLTTLNAKPSTINDTKGSLFMRKIPERFSRFCTHISQDLKKENSGSFVVNTLIKMAESYEKEIFDKNIIHGDIKMDNISATMREGDSLIIDKFTFFDFGLSVDTDNINQSERVGTSSHMAPEVFDPKGDIHKHSDIYSLGVTWAEFIGYILQVSSLSSVLMGNTSGYSPFQSGFYDYKRQIDRLCDQLYAKEVQKKLQEEILEKLRTVREAFRIFLLKSLDKSLDQTALSQEIKSKIKELVKGMLEEDSSKRSNIGDIIGTLYSIQEEMLELSDEKEVLAKAIDLRGGLKNFQTGKYDHTTITDALKNINELIDTCNVAPTAKCMPVFIDRLGVKAFIGLKDIDAIKRKTEEIIGEFNKQLTQLQTMQTDLNALQLSEIAKANLQTELQEILQKIENHPLTIDNIVYLTERFKYRAQVLKRKINFALQEKSYEDALTLLQDYEPTEPWQKHHINKIIAEVKTYKDKIRPHEIEKLKMATDALTTTKEFLEEPNDKKTAENFEKAANAIGRHSAGKRVASAMMILGGIALICVSLGLAVSTFGAGAPVSALLTTMGIAMIATAATGASVTIAGYTLFHKETSKPVERKMDALKTKQDLQNIKTRSARLK